MKKLNCRFYMNYLILYSTYNNNIKIHDIGLNNLNTFFSTINTQLNYNNEIGFMIGMCTLYILIIPKHVFSFKTTLCNVV